MIKSVKPNITKTRKILIQVLQTLSTNEIKRYIHVQTTFSINDRLVVITTSFTLPIDIGLLLIVCNASKWQFLWPISRSSRYTITNFQFFMDSTAYNGRTNARKITNYYTQFCASISWKKKFVSARTDIYQFFCYKTFTFFIFNHQFPSYFDLFSVSHNHRSFDW